MAPIRRYLRITKYSVLEVRIFLEKPSDAPWLLSSKDPVLPRIMKEIQPKVLPKLREENENSKKKGKKKKGIKDVASQEDFEVVLFLTDSSSRHSLLTKHKQFTKKPAITSTSKKMTGYLEKPIEIDDEDEPEILQESDEDTALSEIPEAGSTSKRGHVEISDDEDTVPSSDAFEPVANSKRARRGEEDVEPSSDALEPVVRSKRRRRTVPEEEQDDKKKMAINTSYDGFSIYGKILCLIVKRKGNVKKQTEYVDARATGSEMMEQWISTQANQEADLSDND